VRVSSTGSIRFLLPCGEDGLLPAISTFTDWWWRAPTVPDDPGARQRAAFTFAVELIKVLGTSASLRTCPSMFGIPQDVAKQRWRPLVAVHRAIGRKTTRSRVLGAASMLNRAAAQIPVASWPLLLVDGYALCCPGAHRAVERINWLLEIPALQVRYRRRAMLFGRLWAENVANFIGRLNQFSVAHNDLLAGCDLFITVDDRNIYRRVVGYLPSCPELARNPRSTPHPVRELALVRRGPVTIVAASVKSAAQALEARVEGADVVFAPATVIRDLINHPMSEEASRGFDSQATLRLVT